MRAGWLVLGACVTWACGPEGATDQPRGQGQGGSTGQGGAGSGSGGSESQGGGAGGADVPGGGASNGGGGTSGTGGTGTGNTPISSGGTFGGGGSFSTGGELTAGGNSGAGGSTGPRVFDAGSDLNRNQVVAGNVCDRLATIQCAGEAYCCDSPGRDVATCKATLVAQCRNDLLLDTISLDPLTGFSPSHAETAFAAFEQRSSNCDPGVALWATTASGLRGVVQGTKASGASCTPSLTELRDNPKVAAHLASCSNPAATACLPETGIGATWTCTARGGPGAACFTDINCTDGNYCPNPNLELAGASCLARKPAGQPCAGANECLSLTCKGGACVDATSQTAYCLMQ